MIELPFASIRALSALLQCGELSPVELTEAMLDRIQEHDGRLRSFATVTPKLARSLARAAESEILAGRHRGLLHGLPIAVKDLCFVRGVPSRGGMPLLEPVVPRFDSTVVRNLKRAGAVLLGTLQMTEAATFDHHPAAPVPLNPWGKELWPGISSSGAGVALSAGLSFGSIGSDTGGSLRFPAACTLRPALSGLGQRHASEPRMTDFQERLHSGVGTRSDRQRAELLEDLCLARTLQLLPEL